MAEVGGEVRVEVGVVRAEEVIEVVGVSTWEAEELGMGWVRSCVDRGESPCWLLVVGATQSTEVEEALELELE